MPDISRLVIEVDSQGVVTANGNLENFLKASKGAEKGADDLAKKFGAFQLIVNRLPGPLKSVASGLMGLVSPATAVVSAFLEIGDAAKKYVDESMDAFAKFETIRTNLELVTGSAEEASKMFTRLQRMATDTHININQFSDTAFLLRQANISAKELMPTLEMLGEISGGSAERFDRIAQAYLQIQNMGQATTRELKQLQMAGVPVNKMLEEMGVRGTATADDITEVFRKMTEEGGQFYGAMERASGTINELRATIKGLKEENKALWVESNGLDNISKGIYESQIKLLSNSNEQRRIQIELENILEKKKSGTVTFLDEYRETELKITEAINQLETLQRMQGKGTIGAWGTISSLEKEIALYTSILEQYRPMINAHNELVQKQSEYNEMLERSENGYRSLQARIEETYAKTHQGQKEAIENEITWWRAEQQRMRYIDDYQYNGSELMVIGQKQVGIEKEEFDKIEMIIEMLIQSLDKTMGQALESWQQIFKSAMNLSVDDIKQDWFKKQSTSIAEFSKTLTTVQERAKILSNTLGTDLSQSLEESAVMWERLASEMILSGEWQADTELFLQVVEYAREARDILNETNFDAYLSSLDRELGMLRMTTQEMEKQKLITEFKISNEEKINQALERQGQLRREQEKLSILSSATGMSEESLLGSSGKDLYDQINNFMSIKSGDALSLSRMGLSDYASDLEHIANEWERIYKTISGAMREVDGSYIQIFDPTLEENAELLDGILGSTRRARETSIKQELEDRKQLIWLSEEGIRLKELSKQFGEERAQELNALYKEVEATEALRDALISLKEAGLQLAGSSLIDFAHDLGKAFQDGRISSDEFSGAVQSMLKSLVDAMPQLLLNVGLQLVSKGQWAAGLAFIGASGLMSFVSGLIDDADEKGRQEEAERLKRIQDQISDLIDSQRKQQEYYLTQKRKVNDSAVHVNDAIITPQGTVYTHPDDYIIATKRPDTLMGGGAAPVYVTVINNANATITQHESINEQGAREIELVIDSAVQNGLASGKYDNALDAANQRRSGRRVTH